MQNSVIDILNAWLNYCKFNPDQKSFKIHFRYTGEEYGIAPDSWEMNNKNKTIINIINNYDPSGNLALIYTKNIVKNYLKSQQINLFSYFEHTHIVNDEQVLYNLFFHPDVDEITNDVLSKYSNLVNTIIDQKMIGEFNTSDFEKTFVDNLSNVVESLDKLSIDVFKKSDNIIQVSNYCPNIIVFNIIGECLPLLEKANDGLYLCFISNYGTSDGYFSYFIKSNDNIISLNERINEDYIGQHKNMRNGRWTDDKQFTLFPYNEIFKFAEYDYKGYATKYNIDKKELNIFKLGPNVYNTILLSMLLITSKYVNKKVAGELKYTNSLFNDNVKLLTSNIKDTNSLSIINNSELVLSHKNINFEFDVDKIINGEYNKKYGNDPNKILNKDKGFFDGRNQILIDLFGQDFKPDYNQAVITDRAKLIGTGNQNADLSTTNSEFIRSKEGHELQVYYSIRQQLAEHIIKKQKQALIDFGGVKQLDTWYTSHLNKCMDKIYNMCKKAVLENFCWTTPIEYGGSNCFVNQLQYQNDVKWPQNCWGFVSLNQIVNHDYCVDLNNGAKCSQFFLFKPYNWKNVEELIGDEVPNFCKWWFNDITGYPSGHNHILNVVDPMERVKTPINKDDGFHYSENKFSFNFVIGFSKSGLNKILKS